MHHCCCCSIVFFHGSHFAMEPITSRITESLNSMHQYVAPICTLCSLTAGKESKFYHHHHLTILCFSIWSFVQCPARSCALRIVFISLIRFIAIFSMLLLLLYLSDELLFSVQMLLQELFKIGSRFSFCKVFVLRDFRSHAALLHKNVKWPGSLGAIVAVFVAHCLNYVVWKVLRAFRKTKYLRITYG